MLDTPPKGGLLDCPPVGGTFWFQIFIQAPSPEIWRKTISGGEEVLAGNGVACFALPPWKNFRRRDRDHLVPPRRMDAAVCRAEVCYPFGREHGRHRAMKRREFITLLGGAGLRGRLRHERGNPRFRCSVSGQRRIAFRPQIEQED